MQAPHPEHSITNIWIFGFASPPSRTQCDQYLGIIIYLLLCSVFFCLCSFYIFPSMFGLCSVGYIQTKFRWSFVYVLSCSVCVLSMFRLSSGSFNNCPPGFTVQSYPGLEMLEYLVKTNTVTIYKRLISVRDFLISWIIKEHIVICFKMVNHQWVAAICRQLSGYYVNCIDWQSAQIIHNHTNNPSILCCYSIMQRIFPLIFNCLYFSESST